MDINREQVEKIFPGCINCQDTEKLAKHINCYPSFRPVCGKPLTKDAVDILWKRLEAMQDAID